MRYLNAIDDLRAAKHLDDLPYLLERAAIRIGQFGWWRSGWPKPGGWDCPACVWLAVDREVEEFGLALPQLKEQANTVLVADLMEYFQVETLTELFHLNDKQPDHEGQGWAIYHLNTLARRLRVRYRLQNNASTAGGARQVAHS